MDRHRLLAYLLLLTTAVFWGFASPIVKYTLAFITPVSFLFHRFWLVTIFLLIPVLKAFKKQPLSAQEFWPLFAIGLLGGPLNLLLIFWGANLTDSLSSSLIVATAPVLTVLASAWFLKETVTRREKTGLLIALTGTLFTVIQPLFQGELFARQSIRGNLLVFLSNLAWVAYVILLKRKAHRLSPVITTAITFLSGLVFLTPLFLYEKVTLSQSIFTLSPQAIPGLLYMVFFSSLVAYTAHNWGVSLIEASEATLFTYLQPLFAAPLSFFWLKEPLSPVFLAGSLFITLGLILASWRPAKT